MRCLITCGPTYENLDKVRRLTNFSTGQLGIGLANHFAAEGHEVTLFKGYYATCADECAVRAQLFTTTEDLLTKIGSAAQTKHDAIFHAAAVSDFAFGKVFRRSTEGRLEELSSGKFSTRDGNLLAELIPTPKIIRQLRDFFPTARIFGWKYEVDGRREDALALGGAQIRENRTNFSVVNGPAYGRGFGIVDESGELEHCVDRTQLYVSLLRLSTP
ncbi:MAG TPA: phosphopantothenoylcysteine decarboxylase [Verrucomicrobiae bacterium]